MRGYLASVVLTVVTLGVAWYNHQSHTDQMILMGMEALVGSDPKRQGEASLAFLSGLTLLSWVLAFREQRKASMD